MRLSVKHTVKGDASTGFMSVNMDGYARSAKPNGTLEHTAVAMAMQGSKCISGKVVITRGM